MIQTADEKTFLQLNRERLKPQCEKCFGLCCAALYFSKQEGFPEDKSAGVPCQNLDAEFRCSVHKKLAECGLKGCAAYECFGAGQHVSQVTFGGISWQANPSCADSMFRVFLIMRHLCELCWYLNEAMFYTREEPLEQELKAVFLEAERISRLPPHELLNLNSSSFEEKATAVLKKASALARARLSQMMNIPNNKSKRSAMIDFFGKDLRKKDLRCKDLHGACLIAENLNGMDLYGTDFIGADFRDADLRGADLSRSLFVTQFQINTAKGDSATKLPECLVHPAHWL